jgi:hypothetical protein
MWISLFWIGSMVLAGWLGWQLRDIWHLTDHDKRY